MPRIFLLASLLLLSLTATAGKPGAVVNARIHTMNPDAPLVQAIAWDEIGKVVFLGASEELESSHPDLETVDAGGHTLLPGLIDAHGHVMGLGLARLRADLTTADSLDEAIEALKAHADTLPEGAWLTGRGWDQTRWEGPFPSAADLDEAFPERPVWLVRVDGHAGWANSAALERATRDLAGEWQPQGGAIHRNDDGRPTGILIDTAMRFIEDAMPAPGDEVRERALELAMSEMARYGLTGVHDMGASLADFRLYRRLDQAGDLPVRVTAFADGDEAMLEWLCESGRHSGDRLKARSVKFYADGALGSRGAALLEDYSDDPGNSGLLFESDEDLQALVDRAMGCGLQVGIHAIGDAANRQVIDAIVASKGDHPDNPGRHRIEHVQIIHPDDIPRLAEHDIIASMQPIHATSDMRWARDRLGEGRLEGAYAWATMLEHGIHLALGSDFPVEPVNPWLGIHAAVTRQRDGLPPGGWRPQEALTFEQALRGFTIDAAYAGFAEDQVGSLEVGKQADFIIVDADPYDVEAADLADIEVLRTVVGGETVFEHGE
ncbi:MULTISPECIES: amidohydrolase [unclassified Wenzhouxiangella]|uniref:amidohydrolase n=1 Tax=unclassified Wenzhouxiangella TaxID=2613841 RepID=UPI000E32817D|nr:MULTISPECIES: amidohydrolase [unclassified Wenzhouxiangella]RFF28975.1 amidohydrolase [Wenzhouxiangella sp. 15181]RFP68318.1 amidohydrolase [Wenzhouxiangella sp. 15190]